MAQHDYVISNQSGSAFRADLNNALAAIASQNSGSSEPSTTYAYMLWADTTNGKLKLRNGANNAWVELGNLADAGLGILSNVPLGTVSAPGIAFTGDPNTGIYSPAGDQIAFATGGTQRLNITTAALLPTLPIRGADGTAANPAYSFSGDTDTGIYRVGANQLGIATNGTLAVVVDASGRLGIGNTSPGTNLHIGAGSSPESLGVTLSRGATTNFYLAHDGTKTFLAGVDSSQDYAKVGTLNNYPLVLVTSNNERGRFDASGRFLLNQTSNNGTSLMQMTAPASTNAILVQIGTNGNNAMSFLNAGGAANVGSITVNSAGTAYNTSSDYRLKEDIRPMTGALAKVAALRPVTYKWKADGSDGEGFIAHELQEVVPQCVTGEKDAVELVEVKDEDGTIRMEERPRYQGIDTSFLVATLAAAIQELKAEVDAVKAQLN